MAELEPKGTEEKESYIPASFEKRAAAWMAVVYVLMLLGIFWYALFYAGRDLPGVFPLFLVPVSAALAAVIVHRLKQKTAVGGTAGGVLVLILCAAGVVIGLVLGIPPLLAALAR